MHLLKNEKKTICWVFGIEVDQNEIEKAILKCLSLPISAREKMGQLAREFLYQTGHRFFRKPKRIFEKRLETPAKTYLKCWLSEIISIIKH